MFYRIRTSIAYRYFNLRIREIEDSRPIPCDPQASCEIHTMLGSRDLRMYLLAIKSLLFHLPGVAVVVHSDGTLTDRETARISGHVPGVRHVAYQQADAHAATALDAFPLLQHWRGVDAAYRRLVDVALWRRAERVIVLDADVLTAARPDAVIAWLKSGQRPFLIGQPPSKPERSGSTHVQAQFLAKVAELSTRLGTEPRFLQGGSAGFCGFMQQLSLPEVQRGLQAALEAGLPMEQWGGDQCLVIYLLSIADADRLPIDRYLNFEPSLEAAAERACMLHFYGTHRFYRFLYASLGARVIAGMRQAEIAGGRDVSRAMSS